MNYPKLLNFLVFTLIILIRAEATPLNQNINHPNKSKNQISKLKSPYWEYLLREFVFKTISSPEKSRNILYKKLLEAPFYGGPLPVVSNEDNVLLSSGNVYHLDNGKWILCQENCNDCIPCDDQKNSIVKWTLKRVKRFISAKSFRYDLQLTVIPQSNNGELKNFQTGNYVYVPYESISSNDVASTTNTSHIDRSRSNRSWKRIQRDERGQNIQNNNGDRNIQLTNEHSNSLSSLNHQNNTINSKNFEPTYRLIMGIDQLDKKHIIHIVSIEPSDVSNVNMENKTGIYQLNKNLNRPSYQQYVDKLLGTIHSHRPIIDAFLSYNRIKRDNSTASFHPIYSEFIDSNNNNNHNNHNNNTKFNSNTEIYNKRNRLRDWSQSLIRIPRNKNYIPNLVKKFNGNITNIIRSRSISLF